MRRLAHKRFAAIVAIVGFLLTFPGILLWRAIRPPRFRFLGDYTPVCHKEDRNRTTDVYCFEGDFDELCAEASAELRSRGFREAASGRGSPGYNRIFVRGSYHEIRVSLMDFAFEEATQDSINWAPRPGWVSAEVRRTRGHLWEYLPYEWQLWYQRRVLKSNDIRLRRPRGPLRRQK